MMPLSFSSAPKATAGKESVIKLTHKIWMANNGVGKLYLTTNNDMITMANIAKTSAILVDNKNKTVFLMLV